MIVLVKVRDFHVSYFRGQLKDGRVKFRDLLSFGILHDVIEFFHTLFKVYLNLFQHVLNGWTL